MIADIERPPHLFKISRSPPGTFSAEIESCLHFNTTCHTERNHIELSRTCSLSSFNLRMLSFLLFSFNKNLDSDNTKAYNIFKKLLWNFKSWYFKSYYENFNFYHNILKAIMKILNLIRRVKFIFGNLILDFQTLILIKIF